MSLRALLVLALVALLMFVSSPVSLAQTTLSSSVTELSSSAAQVSSSATEVSSSATEVSSTASASSSPEVSSSGAESSSHIANSTSSSTGAESSSHIANSTTSSPEAASTGGATSSSHDLIASSSSSPIIAPTYSYQAFAAFYVDRNFDSRAAFVLDLSTVSANTCFLNMTNNSKIYNSSSFSTCSYDGALLNFGALLFASNTSCFTNSSEFYNLTAVAQNSTSYSPDLYPVAYDLHLANGTVVSNFWYAQVTCPGQASSSPSDDSTVGVVIGGVVIGVIVVFIVIALLYSRRNRKTVDETGAPITTDANQAYSRL